jgi:hypothetical protein
MTRKRVVRIMGNTGRRTMMKRTKRMTSIRLMARAINRFSRISTRYGSCALEDCAERI